MHALFKLQDSVEVEQTSPSKLNGLGHPGMGSGLHQGPWNSSTLCSQGKNIQFHKHLSLHPVSAAQVAISSEWLIYICDGTARNNKGTAVWSGLELYRTYMWVPLPSYGSLRLNVGIFSHKKNSFQQGVCWSAAADVFSSFLRPFTLRKKVNSWREGRIQRGAGLLLIGICTSFAVNSFLLVVCH